jgi:predicted ATP-binding protein involved in virulence
VEEYKNIQKQGFNFSPRFNCKYDPDRNELIIDKNDDYIENFFGDNINVTAIVGKNGSGKSSVLEFILDRLANRHDVYPKNFIFIYFYKNKLYQYSNFTYTIVSEKINIEDYPNGENLLNYYKDLIAIHINNEYKDVELRDTQQIFSENNKYDKKSSNLVFVENYINNGEQLKSIKETFFTPYSLKISIKTRNYSHSTLYDNQDFYTDEIWKKITNLIEEMKEKTFIENLHKVKEIYEIKYTKHKNSNKFLLFWDRDSPNKYRLDTDFLKDIPKEFQEFEGKNFEILIKDTNNELLSFIRKLPYVFEIDIFDENDINIESLSFGEKQLLTQLHYILNHVTSSTYEYYVPPYQHRDENNEEIGDEVGDYIDNNDIKACLIFVDEFEIGLHPEWQKKTIQYIISFLEVLDIKIHIILTSHSPFLLSDIPKQNIIFLDKDENGNCKVVDGLKDKKQTFGANIHTLLSDSFFMEDGLMGEFAKGKIDKAITLLNQDKLDEYELKYCEQIISIIGEPIVKNQLEKMLHYKKVAYLAKDTREEIEFLKHRIDLLSKRL